MKAKALLYYMKAFLFFKNNTQVADIMLALKLDFLTPFSFLKLHNGTRLWKGGETDNFLLLFKAMIFNFVPH